MVGARRRQGGGRRGVGPLGFVLGRDQWLGRFGNGLENRSFAVEDAQVRDYGIAAVVVGVLAQETSFQGRDNSGRFRLTLVAVRPADRWLLANAHIGLLQQPAGPPPAWAARVHEPRREP